MSHFGIVGGFLTRLQSTIQTVTIPSGRFTELPDLSPVENLWKVLKERICKTYPEIAAYPKSAEAIDRLIAAAEELWTEIEDNVVKNVIKSMPDRLNECYRANGYYTKY
ncbi:uncharacterized protein FFE2_05004 [Fusarium fujikuroi]|nr:uncharacterized protein FFE2_05004 [Fusarium fujikuroi]